MSEPIEEVLLRRLPDGDFFPVHRESPEGPHLRVSLQQAADFSAGTLVELHDDDKLYLGQVVGRSGATLILAIEHAVDRTALNAIQRTWNITDRASRR